MPQYTFPVDFGTIHSETAGSHVTDDEKAALAGTDGTPSATNKLVTDSDARNSNARTPLIHGSDNHTGIIGAWNQVDKMVSDLSDLTTKSHTSLTDIGTTTHADIDSFINGASAYVDYSNISTIEGWSSFYYKSIFYKKIGSFVFVSFYLHGECNSAAASFTLPFSTNAPSFHQGICRVEDNYNWLAAPGYFSIDQGSNLAHFYKDCAGAGFTASGQKGIAGQFFYEAA